MSREISESPASPPTPLTYGIPAISFTSFSALNDPVPSLVRNQTLRFSDSLEVGSREAHVDVRRRDAPHPAELRSRSRYRAGYSILRA